MIALLCFVLAGLVADQHNDCPYQEPHLRFKFPDPQAKFPDLVQEFPVQRRASPVSAVGYANVAKNPPLRGLSGSGPRSLRGQTAVQALNLAESLCAIAAMFPNS